MSLITDKYEQRARSINSMVCIGLDSDIDRLPESFQTEEFPQFAFNKWIIDQTHVYASAYKLNIAFYEARTTAGWHEMQMTVEYLDSHYPDIVTICDAKRGDISSTNKGYVRAIFDVMGFDAITLNPYVGKEGLMPFLERDDKACIILCRTSNQGSDEFQQRKLKGGKRLWQYVAEQVVTEWNENENCMLVAGATDTDDLREMRQIAQEMTLLVPGVGTQGGSAQDVVRAGINNDGLGLIINVARDIIFNESPADAARELRDAINFHL
ncbi:MAG: orotidine-5'-phosphate decarboxylase [Anaerolineae bacterium]